MMYRDDRHRAATLAALLLLVAALASGQHERTGRHVRRGLAEATTNRWW